MAHRDVIVIGAPAGGIEALQQLCAGLPKDLEAALFVILHTSANSGGMLPRLLARAGPLPATHPKDGERIRMGQIYVAPPDFHMVIEPGFT